MGRCSSGSWSVIVGFALATQACGGPSFVTPPPAAALPQAPAPPSEDAAPSCVPLVSRVDRLDHDASRIDDRDPIHAADTLRQGRALVDEAAKDIAALPTKQASVRSLDQDYAAYLRDRSTQLGEMIPLMDQMTAAVSTLQRSQTVLDAAFKKCGSKSCKDSVDASNRMSTATAAFATAQSNLREYVHDGRNKESDKALHARESELNERLHTLCGRPVPSPLPVR